jgi:O-acetyl-ADP-ribose deacetylase (regulator of RNase III)
VIHTVGPVWHGGGRGEHEVLESCYRECLAIAAAQGFRTVGFPAISTGVYGFPKDEAARIAVRVVAAHLGAQKLPEAVVFVCFDATTVQAYEAALNNT